MEKGDGSVEEKTNRIGYEPSSLRRPQSFATSMGGVSVLFTASFER